MRQDEEIQIKPPIGIKPEYLWKQGRMFELIECIARYSTSNLSVDGKWINELGRLIIELETNDQQ